MKLARSAGPVSWREDAMYVNLLIQLIYAPMRAKKFLQKFRVFGERPQNRTFGVS